MVHIISPLFRQPQGYFCSTDPDPTKSKGQKALIEYTTITCGHCNAIVLVDLKAPEPPTEICYGCMRNICKKCVAERAQTIKCDVIEKKLERWEARDAIRRRLVE